MATNLENLARRLEDDPFFLACPLTLYATSEGLNAESLASRMRCSKENFTLVCLCRAPAGEAESFQDDIDRIATKFSVDADLLAEAIRRGQAIFRMKQNTESAGTLLAATRWQQETTGRQGRNQPVSIPLWVSELAGIFWTRAHHAESFPRTLRRPSIGAFRFLWCCCPNSPSGRPWNG